MQVASWAGRLAFVAFVVVVPLLHWAAMYRYVGLSLYTSTLPAGREFVAKRWGITALCTGMLLLHLFGTSIYSYSVSCPCKPGGAMDTRGTPSYVGVCSPDALKER